MFQHETVIKNPPRFQLFSKRDFGKPLDSPIRDFLQHLDSHGKSR